MKKDALTVFIKTGDGDTAAWFNFDEIVAISAYDSGKTAIFLRTVQAPFVVAEKTDEVLKRADVIGKAFRG